MKFQTPSTKFQIANRESPTNCGMRKAECGKRTVGWTLVELLVTISIIGIIIAFFVPPIVSRITNNAKITTTKQEMGQLRSAIMGNPDIVSGGSYADVGFKGDVGRLPRHLIELLTNRPDTTKYVYPGREVIPLWDPFSKQGWHGPYVRDDGEGGFMLDAWGNPYRFRKDGAGNTIGLESAGADGRFFGEPGTTQNDDIVILF